MLDFVNDYSEGAHEKILQRLLETNMEKLSGYGTDQYCESAKQKIREVCECPEADIYFLVGGTQTNATVIDAILSQYEGVVAANTGHISTHEAGAIEASAHKVLAIPHKNGDVYKRQGKYNILHWMALLLKNRTFRLSNEIAIDACDYIIENFSIDLKAYDVIIGYRADDSYFSFAEFFVQNGLPLRSLNEALHLGRLGTQTVLISEKSFRNLTFDGADFADKTVYYPKFIARDSNVRETYRREIRNRHSYKNDIFVLDILREEMKDNDSRIQRILSI